MTRSNAPASEMTIRLTRRQREMLSRAALDAGLSTSTTAEANIAERLYQAGLIRISAYGDRYFATEKGRDALLTALSPGGEDGKETA